VSGYAASRETRAGEARALFGARRSLWSAGRRCFASPLAWGPPAARAAALAL